MVRNISLIPPECNSLISLVILTEPCDTFKAHWIVFYRALIDSFWSYFTFILLAHAVECVIHIHCAVDQSRKRSLCACGSWKWQSLFKVFILNSSYDHPGFFFEGFYDSYYMVIKITFTALVVTYRQYSLLSNYNHFFGGHVIQSRCSGFMGKDPTWIFGSALIDWELFCWWFFLDF